MKSAKVSAEEMAWSAKTESAARLFVSPSADSTTETEQQRCARFWTHQNHHHLETIYVLFRPAMDDFHLAVRHQQLPRIHMPSRGIPSAAAWHPCQSVPLAGYQRKSQHTHATPCSFEWSARLSRSLGLTDFSRSARMSFRFGHRPRRHKTCRLPCVVRPHR